MTRFPDNICYRPLKYVCQANAATLAEETPEDLEIEYIDISAVNELGAISPPETMTFGEAPSRARRIVRSGDVLISTVRTYLKAIAHISRADGNLICSTGFAVLSAGSGVVPRFLYYWVSSDAVVGEIVSRSVGVSYPAINPSELMSLPFPVRTRATQEAIADFLDLELSRIDELISKKQRLIELLDEKRQALISGAVTQGLDPTVPIKPSGVDWIGSVPNHWEVAPLTSRYEVKLGKMLDKRQITGQYLVPYLRNVDVQWDRIATSDLPRMDFDPDDRKQFALRRGDLLVCEGGEVGRAAVWQGQLDNCCYQKALHRLRPRRDDSARYLLYVLRSAATTGVFRAGSNQNTIDHLTAEKLRSHRFAFPPAEEQLRIAAFLDQTGGLEDPAGGILTTTIDRLREYRSALITAAVTGQLDIREHEGKMEALT